MRRLHILELLAAAATALGGCGHDLAREVRLEATDAKVYGTAGADVTLRAANRGDRALCFDGAELRLIYRGGEVLRATLRDTVAVTPRWEGEVRTRWRLCVPDRAALYAVRRKLQRAETQGMAVAVVLQVRADGRMKKIGRRMPLSDFLNIFGLRPEDLLTDFEG